MLGVDLQLTFDEKLLALEAVEELIPELISGEPLIFKLVYSKLNKEDSFVDGMYMRCLEQALTYKESRTQNTEISNKCHKLSMEISRKLMKFQLTPLSRLSLAGA